MWIDCETCRVRGIGCDDCAINALLGPPDQVQRVEMDTDELAALRALADGGLVPPLRMSPLPVMGSPPPPTHVADDDFVDDLGDEWSQVTFWPTGLDPERASRFGRLRERGSG